MGGKVQTASDTARKLATEMGGMKNGGAMKPVDEAKNPGLSKLPSEVRNKMGYMKKGGDPKKSGLAVMIAIGAPMKGMKKPVKKAGGGRTEGRNMKGTPVGPTAGQASAAMQRMMGNQALVAPKNATIAEKIAIANSMPSTGKARFVVSNNDTPVARGTAKTRVAELDRERKNAPPPVVIPPPPPKSPGYKKGGAMMKPVKKAQGGAGKVRKDMMTPEGKIVDAMNKVRGK